jgi:hypothetical protein
VQYRYIPTEEISNGDRSSQVVDVSLARWYHCMSRCVRKTFLLGDGVDDRRKWLVEQGRRDSLWLRITTY